METYEQKYKEALERARLLKLANPYDEAIQTFVKDSFPELKESEDERIRKELIAVINDLVLPDEQKARFNAWLEKQKELKPAEWSEEDEHRCGDAIYFLETAKKHYADTSEIELTIDWLKSLRPQPKVEWSEDDKFKLEDAITGIEVGIDFYEREGKHPNLLKDIIEAKDWLKSLPKRFNLQPKNEWSEEDEEMFDEALAGVLLARNRMNDTGCIGLAERFEKAYKWLESFRPRPHWKPSEEQMKALKIARSFVVDDFSENPTLSEILKALYEQLKKLM